LKAADKPTFVNELVSLVRIYCTSSESWIITEQAVNASIEIPRDLPDQSAGIARDHPVIGSEIGSQRPVFRSKGKGDDLKPGSMGIPDQVGRLSQALIGPQWNDVAYPARSYHWYPD
jgi:hypothetical protein